MQVGINHSLKKIFGIFPVAFRRKEWVTQVLMESQQSGSRFVDKTLRERFS